jgi:DNA-binding MarR family transcriptional regulator
MKEKKLVDIADHIISLKSLFYGTVGKVTLLRSTITPAAFHAILCLKKNGPLSMSDIAKQLNLPKPNVTPLIDKLIEEKLAQRLPDKNDRRIIKIKPTRKGLLFIEKNKKIFREHIKMKLATLTKKELEVFTKSLQIVRDTLAKISTGEINKNEIK